MKTKEVEDLKDKIKLVAKSGLRDYYDVAGISIIKYGDEFRCTCKWHSIKTNEEDIKKDCLFIKNLKRYIYGNSLE